MITPQQDIALGSYYLTKYRESDKGEVKKFFSNITEAKFAYKMKKIHVKDRIKVRFDDMSKFPEGTSHIVETSIGRIFFNEILPNKLPYYNEAITKTHLGNIIQSLLELYGQEKTAHVLDDMKRLGFRHVTRSGYSLGMDNFGSIPEKAGFVAEGDAQVLTVEEQFAEGLLTDSERHAKVLEIWTGVKDKVVSKNKEALNKDGSVFAMIDSKARGSWAQIGQVIGMKGLVASPSGEIIELPVKGNFKEGFDVLEFFISSHGVRKGLSDTALRTANAGYLTRRLVDVAQDVVIMEDDCGDTTGEQVTKEDSEKIGEKLSERVMGRFVLADVKAADGETLLKKGEVVTEELARHIEKRGVTAMHVRSVLQCKLPKGVCIKCYGFDLSNNSIVKPGVAVGIVAAQSIGEPGTQLTMRTFHTGGVAGGSDITQGLPRVEELFEARIPKRTALLSEIAGEVSIEDADGKVITGPTGRKIFEGRRGQKIVKITGSGPAEDMYKLMASDDVKVETGMAVEKGQVLIVRGSGEEVKALQGGSVRRDESELVVSLPGSQVKEYVVPMGYKVWVKEGDTVMRGDQLTEGSVNLQELFELKGRDAVQRYILAEIQAIYAGQGQRLNDKHVEIIIKQMFGRVYVEDAGDTELLPGEVVEKAQLMIANMEAAREDKKQAVGRELFLGISKVSLSTQSFLSAASFQETSKVLINAAITGKVDYLDGLKENVIIGRLIPVGTGFRKEAFDAPINDLSKQEGVSVEEAVA